MGKTGVCWTKPSDCVATHLRCSKGGFYGQLSLRRPEAVELHMQNSAVGLPVDSNDFVNTAGVIVTPPA